MPVEVFENSWFCCKCGQEELGRYKTCTNCGHEKDDNCREVVKVGAEGEGITNEELLKQANAGADNFCFYCKTHNANGEGVCSNCGSKSLTSRSEDRVTVLEIRNRASILPDIVEEEMPRSHTILPPSLPPPPPSPTRGSPFREPAKIEREPPSFPPKAISRPPYHWRWSGDYSEDLRGFMKPHPIGKVLLAIVAAFLFGVVMVLLFRTREIMGKVDSVRWTHTVIVSRYSPYKDEGFDPPDIACAGDATLGECPGVPFDVQGQGKKVHHYDHVIDHYDHNEHFRKVACGQTCEPHCEKTERVCKNLKNGFSRCTGGDKECHNICSTKYCNEAYWTDDPVYRDDPVYKTYYSWRVWRWAENRRVSAQGRSLETSWPSSERVALGQSLAPGEKETAREESFYRVTFREGSDTYEWDPGSISRFKQFPLGSTHHLKVGIAHGVEVLP